MKRTKTISESKIFILDFSKWRAGGDSIKNKIGEGPTLLLNREGFMCCLGQFAIQQGCTFEMIRNKYCPNALYRDIPLLTEKLVDCDLYCDTPLSGTAMMLNDNVDINTDERIDRLRKLLKGEGITLRVINRNKKP